MLTLLLVFLAAITTAEAQEPQVEVSQEPQICLENGCRAVRITWQGPMKNTQDAQMDGWQYTNMWNEKNRRIKTSDIHNMSGVWFIPNGVEIDPARLEEFRAYELAWMQNQNFVVTTQDAATQAPELPTNVRAVVHDDLAKTISTAPMTKTGAAANPFANCKDLYYLSNASGTLTPKCWDENNAIAAAAAKTDKDQRGKFNSYDKKKIMLAAMPVALLAVLFVNLACFFLRLGVYNDRVALKPREAPAWSGEYHLKLPVGAVKINQQKTEPIKLGYQGEEHPILITDANEKPHAFKDRHNHQLFLDRLERRLEKIVGDEYKIRTSGLWKKDCPPNFEISVLDGDSNKVDEILKELLEQSDLCLAFTPNGRTGYQDGTVLRHYKFGCNHIIQGTSATPIPISSSNRALANA